MLDDYFAEFRSLHSELQHLLDNAEAGGAAPQVGIDAKMREIKGEQQNTCPLLLCFMNTK